MIKRIMVSDERRSNNMTIEDILNCVLEDLEIIKRVDNEEIKAEANTNYDDFDKGYYKGRINLCEDLIRFINNNLEVKK